MVLKSVMGKKRQQNFQSFHVCVQWYLQLVRVVSGKISQSST
jgi:hypothetical protein